MKTEYRIAYCKFLAKRRDYLKIFKPKPWPKYPGPVTRCAIPKPVRGFGYLGNI